GAGCRRWRPASRANQALERGVALKSAIRINSCLAAALGAVRRPCVVGRYTTSTFYGNSASGFLRVCDESCEGRNDALHETRLTSRSKEIAMRTLFTLGTTIVVALSAVALAQAGGGKGGSSHSSHSSHSVQSPHYTPSKQTSSYFSKPNLNVKTSSY